MQVLQTAHPFNDFILGIKKTSTNKNNKKQHINIFNQHPTPKINHKLSTPLKKKSFQTLVKMHLHCSCCHALRAQSAKKSASPAKKKISSDSR